MSRRGKPWIRHALTSASDSIRRLATSSSRRRCACFFQRALGQTSLRGEQRLLLRHSLRFSAETLFRLRNGGLPPAIAEDHEAEEGLLVPHCRALCQGAGVRVPVGGGAARGAQYDGASLGSAGEEFAEAGIVQVGGGLSLQPLKGGDGPSCDELGLWFFPSQAWNTV